MALTRSGVRKRYFSTRSNAQITAAELAKLDPMDRNFVVDARNPRGALIYVKRRMEAERRQKLRQERERLFLEQQVKRAVAEREAEARRRAALTPEQRAAEDAAKAAAALRLTAERLARICTATATKSRDAFRAQKHTSGQIAFDNDGKAIHVSAVQRGLACGLRCPVCNEPVMAKKGDIKGHHFSHLSTSACAGLGGEGAVHRWVKQVIFNRFRDGRMPDADMAHLFHQVDHNPDSDYHSVLFYDEHASGYTFDGYLMEILANANPVIEQRKAGGTFIADIGVTRWSELPASIEVVVTHAPDADRMEKALIHRDALYTVSAGHISAQMTEAEVWEALKGKGIVVYPGWLTTKEFGDMIGYEAYVDTGDKVVGYTLC